MFEVHDTIARLGMWDRDTGSYWGPYRSKNGDHMSYCQYVSKPKERGSVRINVMGPRYNHKRELCDHPSYGPVVLTIDGSSFGVHTWMFRAHSHIR